MDLATLRQGARASVLRRIAQLIEAMAVDAQAMAVSVASQRPALRAGEYAALLEDLEKLIAADPKHSHLLRSTYNKLVRAWDHMKHLTEALAKDGENTKLPQGVDLRAFVQPPIAMGVTLPAYADLSSPVTRYAIRLVLAMLTGYGITLALPSYVHGGWVLLTVALIMRASFAVTVQRRNDRIWGTLAGCVFAATLLQFLPTSAIVACLVVGVGVSHAFGSINYKITSFSASTTALLLLHFLEPEGAFVAQRIIDTLTGGALSMALAFVLPSWEWTAVPRLIVALLRDDSNYARQALSLERGEQEYRLARKGDFDAFTQLATLSRRISSEPKRKWGDLSTINSLLVANYLFASDLASVRGFLRGRSTNLDRIKVARLMTKAREAVIQSLDRQPSRGEIPPTDILQRRGWYEMIDVSPMTFLKHRLQHVELSAERLAIHATKAVG